MTLRPRGSVDPWRVMHSVTLLCHSGPTCYTTDMSEEPLKPLRKPPLQSKPDVTGVSDRSSSRNDHTTDVFQCRPGCGACCAAISISSPLPGMPDGKPAGVRCVNLLPDNTCRLHGTDQYPHVCRALRPSPEMCGTTREEAMQYLTWLEQVTLPDMISHTE